MTLNPGMNRFLDNPMPEEDASSRPSIEDNLARLRGGDYPEGRRSYSNYQTSAEKVNPTSYSGIQVSHDDDGGIGLEGVMTDDERRIGRDSYMSTARNRSAAMDKYNDERDARVAAFKAKKEAALNAPIGGLFNERQMAAIMQHPQGPAMLAAMYKAQNEGNGNGHNFGDSMRWQKEFEIAQIQQLQQQIATETDPVRLKMLKDKLDQLQSISAPTAAPAAPPVNPILAPPDPDAAIRNNNAIPSSHFPMMPGY